LPANDPRSMRVRAIGMQFAQLSSRKTIPFSYTVLQNDKVLNAFSGPGGPVFVTSKLLNTTSNDAELAYVLGHETGHIEHKDVVNSATKQQTVGIFAGILGSILTGGRRNDFVTLGTNVAFTLWERGFSREEATNADNAGVHWMSRLGYDPHSAITMLAKLDEGGGGGLDK